MKAQLNLCSLLVALVGLASCGSPDPNTVPDANGITPAQRAKASAAFRSGKFEKSKPGTYEWTTPGEPKSDAEKK